MIRRSPSPVRSPLLRILGIAVLCLGAVAPVRAQEEKSPPPPAAATIAAPADKVTGKDAEAGKPPPAPAPDKATVPEGAAKKAPGGEVKKLGVRVGAHGDHSRLVFDWTTAVSATLDQHGDRLTIRFNKPAKADLSALARSKVLRISQMAQLDDADGLTVSLTIPANAQVTQSRVDDKVVIDIGDARPAPAAAPASATPATTTKPGPEKDVPGKPAPEKNQDAPVKASADTRAAPGDPRAAKGVSRSMNCGRPRRRRPRWIRARRTGVRRNPGRNRRPPPPRRAGKSRRPPGPWRW